MRFKIPHHIDVTLSAARVVLKVAVNPLSPQSGDLLGRSFILGEFDQRRIKFFSHPEGSHRNFRSASRHSTPSELKIFNAQ